MQVRRLLGRGRYYFRMADIINDVKGTELTQFWAAYGKNAYLYSSIQLIIRK